VSSHVVSGRHAELRAAATAQEARRTPARNPVSWFFRLVREVVNKADRDRLLGLAAESAFFACSRCSRRCWSSPPSWASSAPHR
jgi:hypothetical protein